MTPVEREILSLAADDYVGLWDVAAIVEAMEPHPDEDEVRLVASVTAIRLVELGLVDVYVGQWIGRPIEPTADLPTGRARAVESWEPDRVERAIAGELLADRSNYERPPSGPTLVFLLATASGRAAYEGLEQT